MKLIVILILASIMTKIRLTVSSRRWTFDELRYFDWLGQLQAEVSNLDLIASG